MYNFLLCDLVVDFLNQASDATSVYEPHPVLTYEWDPHVRAQGLSRTSSRMTGKGRSYDLAPHPSDPHSSAPLENASEHLSNSSTSLQESVPGQEIWVYEDTKGRTFTFWRFLIRIPLSQVRGSDANRCDLKKTYDKIQSEMALKYTINNGQLLEFFVPGRNQNMRVAAYSVSKADRQKIIG